MLLQSILRKIHTTWSESQFTANYADLLVLQLTDKLVEKIGVQRTPAANPEMYKSDDYSVHLKGHNRTEQQAEREIAGMFSGGCIIFCRATCALVAPCSAVVVYVQKGKSTLRQVEIQQLRAAWASRPLNQRTF